MAFLAYCLHVTLRARLRPMAAGLTPRAVLDKLAGIQMLDVHFPTTDGRTLILSRYTEPNVDQKLLCSASASPCRRSRRRESPLPRRPLDGASHLADPLAGPVLEAEWSSGQAQGKRDRSALMAVDGPHA